MKIYDTNGDIRESIPIKVAKKKGITPKNVAGDICRKTKKEKSLGTLEQALEKGKRRTLTIYPYKEKLSYSERVAGYAPYSETGDGTEYVRIVKKSLPKIVFPLLLILVLVGGGIAWYVIQSNGPDLDRSAIAYEMPDGMKNTDPDQLMLPYYNEVTVTAEDGMGHAVLNNPDGNQSYFRYILTLTDTGDEIYRSGLIEPGMAVADWEINRDLEPGDYAAELAIQTFSLDDHEKETNGGNLVITLHVE